jgi:REP element-mobilizing transposase RayT
MLRPYGGGMAFNPEIHHRRSIRLREYEYNRGGAYFVTMCTHERECLFGDVVDGAVRLTDMGRMVQECWDAISNHFPHCELDAFVVMPNHVHGIVAFAGDVYPVGAEQSAAHFWVWG